MHARPRRGRGSFVPVAAIVAAAVLSLVAVLYILQPTRSQTALHLETVSTRAPRTPPTAAPEEPHAHGSYSDNAHHASSDDVSAVELHVPDPTPRPATHDDALRRRDQGAHLHAALGVDKEEADNPQEGPAVDAHVPAKKQHRTPAPPSSVPEDDAHHGEASGPEPFRVFDDIHTSPLDERQRAIAAAVFATETDDPGDAPEDVDLADVDNDIVSHYRDLPPLPKDDPIQQRFRGPMWRERPLLATVLRRWIVLNREVRQGKRKGGRIVQVNPVGQLCNRLVAITSAFTFALMTGRALHIEDGGFYCQMSDLFMEPGFDWVSLGAAGLSGNTHHLQNPESGVWSEMEPLLCKDYTRHYKEPTVVFSINQYLVPWFATNPHHREQLLSLFRPANAPPSIPLVKEEGDVFTPAAHFLFRPLDMILQMRDKYVAQHFKGHYVVGLQVRSGGDFTDNFMTEHDWGLYKRCGESATPKSSGASLKYFVATDTPRGREAAVKFFGKENVMFGPGEFLLSNHPRGVQMALLDLLLLAASDDRVTTAWSSYGYFAAGFSGVPANTVVDEVPKSKWVAPKGVEQRFMGVMHKSDRRRQCVRLPVHQPCFHKYESWGASKATCSKWEWFEREMLGGRYC